VKGVLRAAAFSMSTDIVKMFIQSVNIAIQISRLKKEVKALRPPLESL